jgi:hypothetical protein
MKPMAVADAGMAAQAAGSTIAFRTRTAEGGSNEPIASARVMNTDAAGVRLRPNGSA